MSAVLRARQLPDKTQWLIAFRKAFDRLQMESNGPIDWQVAATLRLEGATPARGAALYVERHVQPSAAGPRASRAFARWLGASCAECGLPALLHGERCEEVV